MGRAPCCSKVGLHKGPWTPREDSLLTKYIQAHGEGQWKSLPKKAGLLRCGKSCRLRWMNYLRPDIKRGNISPEEDDLIIRMHSLLGNKWSLIAGRLPGRTDNEIKNYWNTHLSKKMKSQGGADSKLEQQEGPNSKKKKSDGKRKSKKEKRNKKGSTNDGEQEKTQVYLPKPIRVKPSSLAIDRTNSNNNFTFDSNNSANSASTSQEKLDQEENNNMIVPNATNEGNNNVVCEVGESDGFYGFFCDDYDLVNTNNYNNSEMECQSFLATDHGTLERLYEEYLQVLNMEDSMYELDSFAESLMV